MARRRHRIRKLLIFSGVVAAVVVVIGGLLAYGSTRKLLPPTTFGPGHSESLPPQQINTQPIPLRVQEHVMEHVGPTQKPGILVQYNCDDYECAPDLVSNLDDLVRDFESVFDRGHRLELQVDAVALAELLTQSENEFRRDELVPRGPWETRKPLDCQRRGGLYSSRR